MATQAKPFTRTGGRVIPTGGNKSAILQWRFMRLSGILLVPLALGHLAIMHVLNSVAVMNYHWVVEQRWSVIGWRIYDAFLLWFAGLHGFRGLIYVLNDYIHNKRARQILTAVIIVLLIGLMFVGSVALIGTPFEPLDSIARP